MDCDVCKAYHAGEQTFAYVKTHLGLSLNESLVDVGCGDGRVAGAFARNGFKGRYLGFDINKDRISECKRLFAEEDNFNFEWLDVFHSYYNPEGIEAPETFSYPCNNASADAFFLNSVFSHMKLSVIRRHLAELRRCVKDRGKIWMTMFVIDKYVRENPDILHWRFDIPYEEGYTAIPDKPEGAIAFDGERIVAAINETGFDIVRYIPGYWKTLRTSLDQHRQDIYVLTPKDHG